jgi:hypothetical protein
MSEPLKSSVNLKGDLRRRLEWYCEVNDLQPAQALKMFVIQGLKKYAKCPHMDIPSRTHKDTNDLSLDKSNSPKGEQVEFVKSFIGQCQNMKFPERISKDIKSHWDAILDSNLSATELADSYNQYVSDSQRNDSIPSHPNSWISGHGWLNKTKEINHEPRGNYDF